jgi:hypothetical protein
LALRAHHYRHRQRRHADEPIPWPATTASRLKVSCVKLYCCENFNAPRNMERVSNDRRREQQVSAACLRIWEEGEKARKRSG